MVVEPVFPGHADLGADLLGQLTRRFSNRVAREFLGLAVKVGDGAKRFVLAAKRCLWSHIYDPKGVVVPGSPGCHSIVMAMHIRGIAIRPATVR